MPLLRAIAGACLGLAVGLLIYGPISAVAGALGCTVYGLVTGTWDWELTIFCVAVAQAFGLPGVYMAAILGARAGWKHRPLLPAVLQRSWSLYTEMVKESHFPCHFGS